MKQGKFGGPIDYFPTQTPQWKQKSLLRKQKPTILEKGKIAGDVITSWCFPTGRGYGRVTIGPVVTVAVEGTFCIPNFLTKLLSGYPVRDWTIYSNSKSNSKKRASRDTPIEQTDANN